MSGTEDLLLYLASSDEERQFAFHVLEIISLMFREQVNIFTPLSYTAPIAVAQSYSGRVTKSQGGGTVLGVFFPIDNA